MQYVVVSVTESSYPRALKSKMRGRKLRCVCVYWQWALQQKGMKQLVCRKGLLILIY